MGPHMALGNATASGASLLAVTDPSASLFAVTDPFARSLVATVPSWMSPLLTLLFFRSSLDTVPFLMSFVVIVPFLMSLPVISFAPTAAPPLTMRAKTTPVTIPVTFGGRITIAPSHESPKTLPSAGPSRT